MATRKKPANKSAPSEHSVAKTAARSPKAAPTKKVATKTTAAKKSTTTTSTKKSTGTKANSATTKKPAEPTSKPVTKSPFSKKFINTQEKKLLEERARYVASAQTWKAEADSLLVDRDPGDVQFDEESGDGDTLAIERERDLALSSHARQAVEEIDEALARIKAGTYGICVTSGLPIPEERLEVIPWAAERVEYKVAGFRRR
jgi:RNA polymerase-binding transcription factor